MPKTEREPRSPESMLAWARLWGRYIDILVFELAVVFLLSAIHPAVARWNSYGLAFVALPFALVLISITQSALGQTFGNLIAGIRVQRVSGERLDLVTAIKREAYIYVYGLGLGLPLISLFTLGSCYEDLRDPGAAKYDQKLLTTVVSCGSNPSRTWLACILYLIALASLSVAGQMRQEVPTPTTANGSSAAVPTVTVTAPTPSLSDELQEAAVALKPKLPMQVDSITKLVDVMASGTTITYTYELKTTPDNFVNRSGNLQSILQKKYCSSDSELEKAGAGQVFDYFTPQRLQHLGSFAFQPSMCAATDITNPK